MHKSIRGSTKKVNLYGWDDYTIQPIVTNESIEHHHPTFGEYEKALDAFLVFFTKDMIHFVLECSNPCGPIKYEHFKEVDEEEFMNWLGFSVFQGAMDDRHIPLPTLFGKFGNPFYSTIISQNRYKEIKNILRFDKYALSRLKQEIIDSKNKTIDDNNKIKGIIQNKETKNNYINVSTFYSETERQTRRLDFEPISVVGNSDTETESVIEATQMQTSTVQNEEDENSDTISEDISEILRQNDSHANKVSNESNEEEDDDENDENENDLYIIVEGDEEEINSEDEDEKKIEERRKSHVITLSQLDQETIQNENLIIQVDNRKYYKIKDLFTLFVENLHTFFKERFSDSIAVDEQLVNFFGRCKFIQYIKSKPGKYGVKLWVATDNVTGMVLNIILYTGGGSTETNMEELVLELLKPFKITNESIPTTIYMDNLFSSVNLFLKLKKNGFDAVGTCRRNRSFIPVEMKEKGAHKQFKSYELKTIYLQNDSIETTQQTDYPLYLLCFYDKPEKPVYLMSTKEETMKFEKKPNMFMIQKEYNAGMGGVDLMDKSVRESSIRRTCNRWPLVIFFNLIDIAITNAYGLMKSKFPSRKHFMIQLACELCHDHQLRRARRDPSIRKDLIKYGIIKQEDLFDLIISRTYYEMIDLCLIPRVRFYVDNLHYFEKLIPQQKKLQPGALSARIHSKRLCNLCKEYHSKPSSNSTVCCVVCQSIVCPCHSGVICIDCLNVFINKMKSEHK